MRCGRWRTRCNCCCGLQEPERHFALAGAIAEPADGRVCVSHIQARVEFAQSTMSAYMAELQRAAWSGACHRPRRHPLVGPGQSGQPRGLIVKRAISKYNARVPTVDRTSYKATISTNMVISSP